MSNIECFLMIKNDSQQQNVIFHHTMLIKFIQKQVQSNISPLQQNKTNQTKSNQPTHLSQYSSQQMSKAPTSSRMVLPNISSTPQLSYTQRYEHMTKLANYNEMNQGPIWKEYEKLRACLKEINEEVLYHMERKAYTNINKDKQKPANKDSQGVLMLLEDQKATNQLRYSNFYNELNTIQQRVNFLTGKHNYIQHMAIQIQQLNNKIKHTKKDIKDQKRKAKVVGKNIVNCTSALDKLMMEQSKLNRAVIRHRRLKEYLDSLANKDDMYREKIRETQQAIDIRIKQFASQENFIQEEIHFERYEQLKKQRENLTKFESVYKRNYLMKLKELQTIVNSINKHDKVIQENQGNIAALRNDIQAVSSLMGKNNVKKRSTSSMLQMSMNTGRGIRSKQNDSRGSIGESMDAKEHGRDNQQNERKRNSLLYNDKNQD